MPKAVVTYHYVEQGSQQWLDDREGKYTGSNAEKLLGRIGVLEYAKAEQSGFGGNFWTKRGHLLEDQAVELYEKIRDVKIKRDDNGLAVGYVTNSLFPNCLYSPDGILENWLIEVKSFSVKKHKELIKQIPVKILAQIHYGLLLTGFPYGELVAYNPVFAKKEIKNDNGEMIENPDYDPKIALVIIKVKRDPAIVNNFKKILGGISVATPQQ